MKYRTIKNNVSKLNQDQLKVVNWNKGPVIVSAGPGSGKTFSIVERITRLIKRHKVNPNKIFASTFTKKAAEEMNTRLKRNGIDTDKMAVQTFHSFCYHIIKGIYRPNENYVNWIVDDGEKYKNIIKQVTGYNGMKWYNVDITEVDSFISLCKNELLRPENSSILPSKSSEYVSFMHGLDRFIEAYFKCEEIKDQKCLLTFDDMLILAYEILKEYDSTREKIQNLFEYVIIDEVQDSNTAQVELTNIIANPQNNLMVVGDIDQGIYRWRGAQPKYMLGFQEKYNAEIISMGINYRSCTSIVERSAKCIENNSERITKAILPNKKIPGTISYSKVNDTDEEALFVSEQIEEMVQDGIEYKSIFILYRTNAQSRALEEVFTDKKIPFVIHGSVSFYKRREIQDLIAYIKLLDDPQDEVSGRRALSRPFRFIKSEYYKEIERRVGEYNVDYVSAVYYVAKKHNISSAFNFVALMRKLEDLIKEKYNVGQLFSTIVKDTEYISSLLRSEGSDTTENSRVSNIAELIRSADRYSSIKDFLDFIKQKKKKKKNDNSVQCMSIHKSKGLEAKVVFIIGCNEDILPHYKCMSITKIEEERRLYYVAMTRAIDCLFITSIDILGNNHITPSRFIEESGIVESSDKEYKKKQEDLFDE